VKQQGRSQGADGTEVFVESIDGTLVSATTDIIKHEHAFRRCVWRQNNLFFVHAVTRYKDTNVFSQIAYTQRHIKTNFVIVQQRINRR